MASAFSLKTCAALPMSPNSSPRSASGNEIVRFPAASSRIFPESPRIVLLMFRPTSSSNMIAGRASIATTPSIFQSWVMKVAQMSSMKTPEPMKMFQGSKPLI